MWSDAIELMNWLRERRRRNEALTGEEWDQVRYRIVELHDADIRPFMRPDVAQAVYDFYVGGDEQAAEASQVLGVTYKGKVFFTRVWTWMVYPGPGEVDYSLPCWDELEYTQGYFWLPMGLYDTDFNPVSYDVACEMWGIDDSEDMRGLIWETLTETDVARDERRMEGR